MPVTADLQAGDTRFKRKNKKKEKEKCRGTLSLTGNRCVFFIMQVGVNRYTKTIGPVSIVILYPAPASRQG